jgi:hypothetical protein
VERNKNIEMAEIKIRGNRNFSARDKAEDGDGAMTLKGEKKEEGRRCRPAWRS